LNKHPYHLHAICIHDGNANSGHYYAFIKDHYNSKWLRFNDVRVSDVTEEQVFKEANGGSSWMTAYWLVYVNEEQAEMLKTLNLTLYNAPEKEASSLASEAGQQDALMAVPKENLAHHYQEMIPGAINMLVEDENLKLRELIEGHQAQSIVREI
jgi:ubiquitin carboxyl-terminal hydrolase 25/28